MRERQKREQEQSEKMKKRFNSIIQKNQLEKLADKSSQSDIELDIIPDWDVAPACQEKIQEFENDEQEQIEVSEDLPLEIQNNTEENQTDKIITNEGEFYEVEKICDKRIINLEVHYLVKWKGLPFEESTWEPIQNLIYVQHLIRDFNKNFENVMKNKLNKDKKKKKDQRPKREGSYENGDIPSKIVKVRRDVDSGELVFTIEWNQRENGSIPMQSNYSNRQLRKFDPHLLLSFYESKVKLV